MQEFDILKNNIERVIYQLTLVASDIYSKKCNQNNAHCNVKYFDQCKGVDESVCFIGLPKISQQCKADGNMISKSCGIRLPNNLNINSLTNDQKLFVCASHQIDDYLIEAKKIFLNYIERIYMGTYFDYFRVYPGEKIFQCNNYLPSQRLWYLIATTGSKNIIIIIDISSAQYLPKIKEAVKEIIKTLSFNDFIGIIIMRNQSKILIEHTISRATEQMKNTLINSVNSLVEDTNQPQINYQIAFKKVNQMLIETFDYYGPSCKYSSNIIMLLTSKAPTTGLNTSQSLSQMIGQWNNIHKIKLFTFGFGETLNPNLLKSLSCQFQGASFSYPNLGSVNLVEDIRIYQKFLSAAVNNNQVTWTQPYRDAFTKKLMITASMPIYFFQGQNRIKIGAMGIDVLWQKIQDDIIGQDKVKKQMLKCPHQPVILDKCIIQNLRLDKSKCGIQNCNKNTNKSTCTWTTNLDNIFSIEQKNLSKNTNNSCCPHIVQEHGLVGFISIGVILLIGIIFLIFICRRSQPPLQQLRSQNNSQQLDSRNHELEQRDSHI